jgi:choline kinase
LERGLATDKLKVVLLAAGVGRRLGGDADHPPKALTRFGGKSLLRRHLEILDGAGIAQTTVVVGYKQEEIADEVAGSGLGARVRLAENPRFREGSMVSLWTARETLRHGGPVLIMDADVLYDHRLMHRLMQSPIANCFLLDREIEPGDEPVKLCIADGRIVDFHKKPRVAHEWHGESVGFFRFTPEVADELAGRTEQYVAAGKTQVEYEEAIRDMVLESPAGRFDYEDVTGLPWTEIDFPEDVRRAAQEIAPRLQERETIDAISR